MSGTRSMTVGDSEAEGKIGDKGEEEGEEEEGD